MNLTEIFAILIIHWFADFVLQTDKEAKGKSKNWSDLLSHTSFYSLFWLLCGIALLGVVGISNAVVFTLITFIAHTITDYYTSRLNSKLWADGKVHSFFISIGFDQVLHYVQLFTTYWILFK
jgi:hypothetical protein